MSYTSEIKEMREYVFSEEFESDIAQGSLSSRGSAPSALGGLTTFLRRPSVNLLFWRLRFLHRATSMLKNTIQKFCEGLNPIIHWTNYLRHFWFIKRRFLHKMATTRASWQKGFIFKISSTFQSFKLSVRIQILIENFQFFTTVLSTEPTTNFPVGKRPASSSILC